MSLVAIVTNFYCIVTGIVVKDLHKLDFFLALLQCVCDFSISGCFSVLYNLVYMNIYIYKACQSLETAENYGCDFIPKSAWKKLVF